jgi:hypothetical protein
MHTPDQPLVKSLASNPKRKTRIPRTRAALHGGLSPNISQNIIEEEPESNALQEGSAFCPAPRGPRSAAAKDSPKQLLRGSQHRAKQKRFPVRVSNWRESDVESIWQKYHSFWESDQGGVAIIAHDHSLAHNIVVVKKIHERANDSQFQKLRKVAHDNMVKILDIFTEISLTYIVYESLETSLEKVQATCRGELMEIDMATIAKEVCSFTTIRARANGVPVCRSWRASITFTMNLILFTAKWCPKISCCRIAHAVLS